MRPSAPDLICRKLGEVGFTLYASKRYLSRAGVPNRGHGLAGHDLITFTGAPAAASPFFLGESLDGARIALRCDNPLIQRTAAANNAGIAEFACFLGDCFPDVVRVAFGDGLTAEQRRRLRELDRVAGRQRRRPAVGPIGA